MNILFITPYLPSENSGHAGAQLIYRNIISLSRNHKIVLASFIDRKEIKDADLLKKQKISVFTIKYIRNRASLIGRLISVFNNLLPISKYLFSFEPFFISKYHKNKMSKLISKLINTYKFDIVQVEYNVMHHYTKFIGNLPRVINFHDISAKVYEREINAGYAIKRKSYNLAKKIEPIIANKFHAVITLSNEDKNYLTNLGCTSKIYVIPPQIRIPKSQNIYKNKNEICFIGSFNRKPNIHAITILIKEILPNLSSNVKLNIVGKALPNYLYRLIKKNKQIKYWGYIPDIDKFISTQMIMVAPIFIGSGIKMKIPHSLICCTSVLTTDIGIEGINIGKESGAWSTNNIKEMINLINKLLSENNLLVDRAKIGRDVVAELFSESKIIQLYEILYSDMLKK